MVRSDSAVPLAEPTAGPQEAFSPETAGRANFLHRGKRLRTPAGATEPSSSPALWFLTCFAILKVVGDNNP